MRSFLRSNVVQGICIPLAMVVIAAWVAVIIDRHAEEHGHRPPLAMIDVERTHRRQVDADGKGQDVGHARMVSGDRPGNYVRGGCR